MTTVWTRKNLWVCVLGGDMETTMEMAEMLLFLRYQKTAIIDSPDYGFRQFDGTPCVLVVNLFPEDLREAAVLRKAFHDIDSDCAFSRIVATVPHGMGIKDAERYLQHVLDKPTPVDAVLERPITMERLENVMVTFLWSPRWGEE